MVVGQTGDHTDVLVIGGGPGGYSAAIRAAQLGRSVTLVERGRLGGVCLNDGCIPSKALLSAARTFAGLQHAAVMGIDARAQLDFRRLQDWKQSVVDTLSGGVAQLLQRYGVTVMSGTANFVNRGRVAVGAGEAFEFIEFSGCIIATGSRPRPLDGIPFDGERVLTPEQALALAQLPPRIAIVGGDYVGLEIATAYRRLGAAVTVVEAGERLLPELDLLLGRTVSAGLRRLGVELRLHARIASYDADRVRLEAGSDGEDSAPIAADVVIVAGARQPNTDELSLERAGVQRDVGGHIAVDSQCRSGVASICAAGDVVAGSPVAQRAIAQGRVAAEVLAGQPSAYDPAVVPLAYFTEPEVLSVGLSEAAARAAGLEPLSSRFPFGASGRAATLGDQQGVLQVVAEAGTRRVLGIHAAGPLVTELAGEAALAIELTATLDDLSLTIHPHPTLSEAIPEAAWLALEAPLHVFRSPGPTMDGPR